MVIVVVIEVVIVVVVVVNGDSSGDMSGGVGVQPPAGQAPPPGPQGLPAGWKGLQQRTDITLSRYRTKKKIWDIQETSQKCAMTTDITPWKFTL